MGETCCFECCKVKTGTYIIGFIDVILSIAFLPYAIIDVNLMINDPKSIDDEDFPGFANYPAAWIAFCIVEIIFEFIYLAFSLLLIHGARSMNWRHCIPWLYCNYFFLGFLAVGGIAFTLLLATIPKQGPRFALAYAVVMLIVFAILYYFVNVVRRFIKEIKEYEISGA